MWARGFQLHALLVLDVKKGTNTLLEDSSKKILEGIELGEVHDWNYTHSRGETIYGRYYLPPHFDPAKKYPMIVNYYGGCSPTGRNFESRYPHHLYAARGYVVYIVQPSGATGFGQEFAARHVNTRGEGGAEDIIEGVENSARSILSWTRAVSDASAPPSAASCRSTL